jgi:hypothetical protein
MAPFLRRDYEEHQEIFLNLSPGIRTSVPVGLSRIEFIMAQVVDESGAIVGIYRNLSPEYWQFSKHFSAWDVGNCTSVSLKADTACRVQLVVGGEA